MKQLIFWICTAYLLTCHCLLADLNSGLIAYYPFNGNANDESGNGHDGIVQGAIPDNDRFGNPNASYLFVGITNSIRVNVGPQFFAPAFTFSVWVKFSDFIPYYPQIACGDTYYIELHGCGIPYIQYGLYQTVTFYQQTSPNYSGNNRQGELFTTNNVFTTNVWYHLCVTRNGTDFRMYVNGTLSAETTDPNNISLSGSYMEFGNNPAVTDLNTSFHGNLDDISIYNRALSNSEVLQLYNFEKIGAFPAIVAASTVQTSLPTYPPTPVVADHVFTGLVFITHGAIFDGSKSVMLLEATNFVNGTSNAIAHYLASNNITSWQVDGHFWTDQATVINPDTALNNAQQIGVNLGNAILAEQDRVPGAWTNIHFIAHSAGAGMIQKATEIIKASQGNNVTIHCTFLDAFDGEVIGANAYEYGTKADWADSYFVRDSWQQNGWTGRVLPNAYNVDVTPLDPASSLVTWYNSSGSSSCDELQSTHGWPPSFYSNSIVLATPGNTLSVINSAYYGSYGFPLSEEAGTTMIQANNLYPPGNGVLFGSVVDVGNDYGCVPPYFLPPFYIGPAPSFSPPSTIESTTGNLAMALGNGVAQTGSPVWISTVITDTNALNLVSFDAEFTSAEGAHGLLTVYWDTNMIGEVDEGAVQPGLQHYNMSFPNTFPNTSHVLGFHVDPFTEVHSTLVLTNIVTGCVGVSQPFTLSITMNNGSPTYQLTGQPANYAVQSSPDLVNWTTIAYLANTNGTVNFADTNSANNPIQFYRAISPTMMSE